MIDIDMREDWWIAYPVLETALREHRLLLAAATAEGKAVIV